MMKNIEELRKNDKIKEILYITKSLKDRNNPQNLKEYSPLLHSAKTQHQEFPNAIINDAKYVI